MMKRSIKSILLASSPFREQSYASIWRLSVRGLSSSVSPKKFEQVPTLKDFMQNQQKPTIPEVVPTSSISSALPPITLSKPLKFYIETYGCQMNVSDSEIVRSVLLSSG